jgi:uncharacterized membrane protein YeaQ/YmgE (transglycosylase-associated protein family)
MSIVAFILVGLIAGFLAGKIVEGQGFGAIGDIVVGVIGAMIGGLISNRVIGETYGFWGSVVVATLGAVILLFIARMIGVGTKSPRT